MDDGTPALHAAREAYGRHDWAQARERFLAARSDGGLPPEDLYSLADAEWWLGMVTDALRNFEEAYRRFLGADLPRRAAMSALDVAFTASLRGDESIASGWMNRFQRLLSDLPEGPEHGYAEHIELESSLGSASFDELITKASHVREMSRRYDDVSLSGLSLLDEGRILIKHGRVREGLGLLDEAMLVATSGEMILGLAGNIYCSVIQVCHELADLRRMADWTQALQRWCEQLPPAVLFTGICRVHRVQLMQVRGLWDEAEAEAHRIRDELREIHVNSVAAAEYAIGELRRLRGDLSGAEVAFQQAHRLGVDPQPGLALLRLAQGRTRGAAASVLVALSAHPTDRLARFPLLVAQVEIALAAADHETARGASAEISAIAADYGGAGLKAAALSATGAVCLADGRCGEAVSVLREACRHWQDLDAPYEVARVRLRLAEACQALSDPEGRSLELDAAAETFARLGASGDAGQVARLRGGSRFPDGLTPREVDVLALVAVGRTNREVAAELVISEKTVARHLSNIFAKCGLASRTAAAAYAFDRGLIARSNG